MRCAASRRSRGCEALGADQRRMTAPKSWFEELRDRQKPRRLEVLLVAESPPDPGAGERRFFYSPTLTIDNLYRGVAEALYGTDPSLDVGNKPAVLERLRQDGFWLIDAVEYPINKLPAAQRRAAIRSATPALVDRCRTLAPRRGVIICHAKVHEAVADALRDAGVPVLNEAPLPFPLGNWRRQFIEGFRRALAA